MTTYIEDYLEQHGRNIKVAGLDYTEITNFVYNLDYYEKGILEDVPVPHKKDELERNYLLERADDAIEILKKDNHSRQAIYANLYLNKMGKCISTVHFFSRDGQLHLNTYFRSQEYEKNFKYDHQTHVLLMKKVRKALDLKPGTITVFCANLHRTLDDKQKKKDSN